MNCILVMFLFFSSGPSPQHYTTPLNLVLCTICSVPGSVMIRVILSSCLLVCCLSGDVCLDLERLKQCLLHRNNLLRPPTRPVKREKRTHDRYENFRKIRNELNLTLVDSNNLDTYPKYFRSHVHKTDK